MAGSARVGAWFAKNWFLVGLLAAVAVGLAVPRAGIAASLDGTTATVLVVVLFFLSGLCLPTEAIASGLRDVRLHLFLQAFIFVAVPLYFAASAALLWRGGDPRLLAGIYALAVLPTTVSSCIVFTQAARGNVVATIFNASLANVAGVFLSPLLLSLLLQQSGRALPTDELLRVLTALALKMLLPFALGQVARARLRELAQRLRKAISVFMNASIVVIIWFSFSRPALDPAFAASLVRLWPLFGYLALSHLLLLGAGLGSHPRAAAGQGQHLHRPVRGAAEDPGDGRAAAHHLLRHHAGPARRGPAAAHHVPPVAAHGGRLPAPPARPGRGIAARGETPAAFERRSIPAGCVAPRSHIAPICSFVAPCQPGASPLSVPRRVPPRAASAVLTPDAPHLEQIAS